MLSERNLVYKVSIIIGIIGFYSSGLNALSSLAKNDPYPVFSSVDPHDYLTLHEKLQFKSPEFASRIHDNVGISISPFGQNADNGVNIDCKKAPIGDLSGRWSMLGLLYGPIPPGQTLAPSLQTALDILFPGMTAGQINDATKIDPAQQFGFFSTPLKYRKRGVRFDLSANMIGGFGINVQTGVVCMSQTNTGLDNLTCVATNECGFKLADNATLLDNVNEYLMDPIKTIAKEIKLDICDFSEVSVEEVRINLFWRRPFIINEGEEDWAEFLLMPFFEISGSVSPGDVKDPDRSLNNKKFAVPFGNNGHSAVGFTAGLDFDFVETMEIGAEVGTTYFFKKDFDNFRVPTSCFQSGIFPYRTSVSVTPGINWHFGAKLAAFHFIDRLSGFFEYIQLEHKSDDIDLKKCDDEGVFLPKQLEKVSGFKTKLINLALNYDIAPNIGLGILWQLPLSQANSYRSSTIMFSFNARF